jgi:hypothetical protein
VDGATTFSPTTFRPMNGLALHIFFLIASPRYA